LEKQISIFNKNTCVIRLCESLNVTATSLIFPFFAKFRSEHKKRKSERVARVQMEKEREERKREKNGIFLFGNSNRNRILKGIRPVKEIEHDKRVGNRKFNRFSR
jgi:hypothetical protein